MVGTALPSIFGDIKLFLAIDTDSVASSQSLGAGCRWARHSILFLFANFALIAVVAVFTIFAVFEVAVEVRVGRGPRPRDLAFVYKKDDLSRILWSMDCPDRFSSERPPGLPLILGQLQR